MAKIFIKARDMKIGDVFKHNRLLYRVTDILVGSLAVDTVIFVENPDTGEDLGTLHYEWKEVVRIHY